MNHKLIARIQHFLTSEDGPTAVEYAVMLALIIVVCIVAIGAVGTETSEFFQDSANKLDEIMP
jgi:pilus assembly protein Flp/PilA